jgi:hypothetical protein
MTFREYVEASNKLRKNLQALEPGSGCSSICSAHLPETSEHMVANQIALVQRQQEEFNEHMGDVDGNKDKVEERVDKGKGRKEENINMEEIVNVAAAIVDNGGKQKGKQELTKSVQWAN